MSDRKPTFFTSDWHIGHQNVLQFDQRPFNDLDHMHESLIRNFNVQVPAHGVTYFLGDMGLGSSGKLKEVIGRLNGTKVLILGNHDKGSNAMYGAGFDVVLNTASMMIAQQKVTLSHCPLRGAFRESTIGMHNAVLFENWHGENRHHNFSLGHEGQFHLHGHIHSGPANKKARTLGRQMDVGVPANNYRPVGISQVESWIVKTLDEEFKDRMREAAKFLDEIGIPASHHTDCQNKQCPGDSIDGWCTARDIEDV
jgi:calcineurin-like phosphoesterase family protein